MKDRIQLLKDYASTMGNHWLQIELQTLEIEIRTEINLAKLSVYKDIEKTV